MTITSEKQRVLILTLIENANINGNLKEVEETVKMLNTLKNDVKNAKIESMVVGE